MQILKKPGMLKPGPNAPTILKMKRFSFSEIFEKSRPPIGFKHSQNENGIFHLKKYNYNYSYILGYRSYRLITVTVTVFEKVTVTVAITVTVSLRDYKVAYASFQASRRPARKLVTHNK